MSLNIRRFLPEALRAIAQNKHEFDEQGRVHIQKSRTFLAGYMKAHVDFGDRIITVGANRVVNQGLDKVLNLLGGHVSAAALYIAPFSGDAEPSAGWTGVNFASLATEFTAYTPGTRLPWTTVPSTAQNLSNAAALAAATMTLAAGGPYIIRGAGLLEASAKGATTGPLIAAARLDADLIGMPAGGKIAWEYGISALDESDA